MDYRTMGQMEVRNKKFPEAKKQIYIVQGNLDDEKLRQLPKVTGTILVTGNVFFVENNNTVPCALVVLGDFSVQKASVHGSLVVCGQAEAERLIVQGDFCRKPGAKIKDLLVIGEVISI